MEIKKKVGSVNLWYASLIFYVMLVILLIYFGVKSWLKLRLTYKDVMNIL